MNILVMINVQKQCGVLKIRWFMLIEKHSAQYIDISIVTFLVLESTILSWVFVGHLVKLLSLINGDLISDLRIK